MGSGTPHDRPGEDVVAALGKSEAQLATIIENLTEGVIASTLEGDVLLWNPAAIAMHGFASLEECRRMLPEFDTVFDLSTPQGVKVDLADWPLSRVLRGEQLREVEMLVHRTQPGWTRRFSYSGGLVRDSDGNPLMAVITVRDVTEVREREQRLQDALAQKDRLVAELSAALQNVRTLSALLPVCSWCGKIRNDEGEYERMESYIQRSVGTEFTHGLCPDCLAQHFGTEH
jgi:PAS domain S-box-containing protein